MYFHWCWISSIKRDVNMITLWLLEKSESTSSTFGLCLGGFAIILLVGFENDSDFQRHTWSSDADEWYECPNDRLFEHQTSNQLPSQNLSFWKNVFQKKRSISMAWRGSKSLKFRNVFFCGWNRPFKKGGSKKGSPAKFEERIEILLGRGSWGSICQMKFRNHTSIFQRVLFQP